MIEIRAPFLLLPIVLAADGSVLAIEDGQFDLLNFVMFATVLVILHITVNTLNEYYDHKSGIDLHTKRTMFNGGSGIIQAGLIEPREVLTVAIGCYALAALLSAYLIIAVSWLLVAVIVPGMLFALFYTQVFARNMFGEVVIGLGLGSLPVIGAYLVQNQEVTPLDTPGHYLWLADLQPSAPQRISRRGSG
jgi:1,4-dihydroxy-2-naphthoate octaprenyltransferase